MDSSVNSRTDQNPSQIRKNEPSTPAPKFGGIRKKQKKFQLTRRARISLNTSTSGRRKIKTLASKINTSLNSSRIVKEALNHNNRALVTEQQRIQNEIQSMRQKCEDLVEENEDIVYELEMIDNLMNLTDSEEKVQAVIDMRVQAHMSQLTDEIEKTVYNFKQALRGVVSLQGLIRDPRRILSMPLDSPRDNEETKPYMERLQEIFRNTDIYDEHDKYDNDLNTDNDDLPDNQADEHPGRSQLNSIRGQGFVGLPQRIPCSSTDPTKHQVDTFSTSEFYEALEDDFDINSNEDSGNVQNFGRKLSSEQDVQVDEAHQSKNPQSNDNRSTELSEDYPLGQEDMTMYPNTDMEMTAMIGPTSPTSKQSAGPVSSSVKSSPKTSHSSPSSKSSSSTKSSQSRGKSSYKSSPTQQAVTSSPSSKSSSSTKSSQSRGKSSYKSSPTQQAVTSSPSSKSSSSTKSSQSSGKSSYKSSPTQQAVTSSLSSKSSSSESSSLKLSFTKSSQSRDKSSASSYKSSPTQKAVTSSSLENKQSVTSSRLSSNLPITKSFASSDNVTSPSSTASDFIDPEHTIYLNSDMEMTAVVEAPFSFIEPQPPSQFKKTTSPEKQNQHIVGKVDKFGPENLFGFEVETPKFNKSTKTTELSKLDKFERIKIDTSFTLDKSLREECLTKETKSRSRTKPRSKKAVVEEIGIFNSESNELHDIPLMSEDKRKSISIEESQGTSRSKRKLQRGEDALEDSEPCVLFTFPSEYTVPLNKESPSPKKSKSRSQSRGRSKSKKKKEAGVSDKSEDLVSEQNFASLPLSKTESNIKCCGEQESVLETYTVPMKKDSPVSNIKSTARSQSRGRSKTKKNDIQSVDTQVNDETLVKSNIKVPILKTSKPNSNPVSDSSDVYTVPMKTDSPETKPKSRTRSQSRGRSKTKSIVSSEKSSDGNTLDRDKHCSSKSESTDDSSDVYTVPMKTDSPETKPKSRTRSQSRGRSKTKSIVSSEKSESADDSSDVYTVPMKTDSPETKQKSRTRSQSRGRSRKPDDTTENSFGGKTLHINKDGPSRAEPTDNFQNKKLSKVQNQTDSIDDVPLKDTACSKNKSSCRSQSKARSKKRELIVENANDTGVKAPRTNQRIEDTNEQGDKSCEVKQDFTYNDDDIVSPTVHIKPKSLRKRIIESDDDMDSPLSQIKAKASQKTLIDEDEMIPDSQPVKRIFPLKSKKRIALLASETDDEPEEHNILSSSKSTPSSKRKSESPINNMAKKPKPILISPKGSQSLLKPEILVIPDSTKKSRNSVMNDDDDEDQENLGKRSRRAKGCVSYKEKPLNVKMRRQTVDGKTVEYINTGRLSEKVRVSRILPLDSVSNNRNSSS